MSAKRIATFDACHATTGTIDAGQAICDVCKVAANCLIIDCSEGEYDSGRICLPCAAKALSNVNAPRVFEGTVETHAMTAALHTAADNVLVLEDMAPIGKRVRITVEVLE